MGSIVEEKCAERRHQRIIHNQERKWITTLSHHADMAVMTSIMHNTARLSTASPQTATFFGTNKTIIVEPAISNHHASQHAKIIQPLARKYRRRVLLKALRDDCMHWYVTWNIRHTPPTWSDLPPDVQRLCEAPLFSLRVSETMRCSRVRHMWNYRMTPKQYDTFQRIVTSVWSSRATLQQTSEANFEWVWNGWLQRLFGEKGLHGLWPSYTHASANSSLWAVECASVSLLELELARWSRRFQKEETKQQQQQQQQTVASEKQSQALSDILSRTPVQIETKQPNQQERIKHCYDVLDDDPSVKIEDSDTKRLKLPPISKWMEERSKSLRAHMEEQEQFQRIRHPSRFDVSVKKNTIQLICTCHMDDARLPRKHTFASCLFYHDSIDIHSNTTTDDVFQYGSWRDSMRVSQQHAQHHVIMPIMDYLCREHTFPCAMLARQQTEESVLRLFLNKRMQARQPHEQEETEADDACPPWLKQMERPRLVQLSAQTIVHDVDGDRYRVQVRYECDPDYGERSWSQCKIELAPETNSSHYRWNVVFRKSGCADVYRLHSALRTLPLSNELMLMTDVQPHANTHVVQVSLKHSAWSNPIWASHVYVSSDTLPSIMSWICPWNPQWSRASVAIALHTASLDDEKHSNVWLHAYHSALQAEGTSLPSMQMDWTLCHSLGVRDGSVFGCQTSRPCISEDWSVLVQHLLLARMMQAHFGLPSTKRKQRIWKYQRWVRLEQASQKRYELQCQRGERLTYRSPEECAEMERVSEREWKQWRRQQTKTEFQQNMKHPFSQHVVDYVREYERKQNAADDDNDHDSDDDRYQRDVDQLEMKHNRRRHAEYEEEEALYERVRAWCKGVLPKARRKRADVYLRPGPPWTDDSGDSDDDGNHAATRAYWQNYHQHRTRHDAWRASVRQIMCMLGQEELNDDENQRLHVGVQRSARITSTKKHELLYPALKVPFEQQFIVALGSLSYGRGIAVQVHARSVITHRVTCHAHVLASTAFSLDEVHESLRTAWLSSLGISGGMQSRLWCALAIPNRAQRGPKQLNKRTSVRCIESLWKPSTRISRSNALWYGWEWFDTMPVQGLVCRKSDQKTNDSVVSTNVRKWLDVYCDTFNTPQDCHPRSNSNKQRQMDLIQTRWVATRHAPLQERETGVWTSLPLGMQCTSDWTWINGQITQGHIHVQSGMGDKRVTMLRMSFSYDDDTEDDSGQHWKVLEHDPLSNILDKYGRLAMYKIGYLMFPKKASEQAISSDDGSGGGAAAPERKHIASAGPTVATTSFVSKQQQTNYAHMQKQHQQQQNVSGQAEQKNENRFEMTKRPCLLVLRALPNERIYPNRMSGADDLIEKVRVASTGKSDIEGVPDGIYVEAIYELVPNYDIYACDGCWDTYRDEREPKNTSQFRCTPIAAFVNQNKQYVCVPCMKRLRRRERVAHITHDAETDWVPIPIIENVQAVGARQRRFARPPLFQSDTFVYEVETCVAPIEGAETFIRSRAREERVAPGGAAAVPVDTMEHCSRPGVHTFMAFPWMAISYVLDGTFAMTRWPDARRQSSHQIREEQRQRQSQRQSQDNEFATKLQQQQQQQQQQQLHEQKQVDVQPEQAQQDIQEGMHAQKQPDEVGKRDQEDDVEKHAEVEQQVEKQAEEQQVGKQADEQEVEKQAEKQEVEKQAKEQEVEKQAKEQEVEKQAEEQEFEKSAEQNDKGNDDVKDEAQNVAENGGAANVPPESPSEKEGDLAVQDDDNDGWQIQKRRVRKQRSG